MTAAAQFVSSAGRRAAGRWPLVFGLLSGLLLLDNPSPVSTFVEPLSALGLTLWQTAREVHPDVTLRALVKRILFTLRAWWCRDDWAVLRQASPHSPLGQMLRARHGRMHLLAWAYVHRDWSVRQRVEALRTHYAFVEQHAWLNLPLEGRQRFARIDAACPGLSLQFERPDWIENEGELAISLFRDDVRLYQLSLLFAPVRGEVAMVLGAIQGRHAEAINEVYVELTRQLHGCRPRDLLVHAALFIGEALGQPRVYAVSDACRHHRAAHWRSGLSVPTADYDQVWRDRGGVLGADGLHAIDTAFRPRDLATVASKKRAMYRRRYEMLGALRDDIQALVLADRPPQDVILQPAR